ncbi:MAG: DsrE family protein [Candidatus Omnitrophica bacterium]|nr:DsrE family protein [Candidatus Omnitrophota bacterium]
MRLGIILYSSDAEVVWNAFRLGVYALGQNDSVKVFLLAKGVECESLKHEKFNVREQMEKFLHDGGKILACGTCLKIRNQDGSEMCPLSTMKDLYDLIKESDKVVSF